MLQQKYSGSLCCVLGPNASPKSGNKPVRHSSEQMHQWEEILSSRNLFFRTRMKRALLLTSIDDAYSNMSLLFTQMC